MHMSGTGEVSEESVVGCQDNGDGGRGGLGAEEMVPWP